MNLPVPRHSNPKQALSGPGGWEQPTAMTHIGHSVSHGREPKGSFTVIWKKKRDDMDLLKQQNKLGESNPTAELYSRRSMAWTANPPRGVMGEG